MTCRVPKTLENDNKIYTNPRLAKRTTINSFIDNQQTNVVSRQENTNKNTRQNAENSNPTVMAKSSNPQGREANSKDDFRPDKRPDPPTKTGQEVDQQYENSSGGLRDKRPDPEVKTCSSPEVGHLLSKEQQHDCGGLGDKRPDPLKITVTSPEGLQLLSQERKKCDLKQEIQAKQILNSAEQTGQSSVKEKQKDIVSPGPGGVNKDDKYTEHSKPFETTQARAGQSSEEQRKGVHKEESNANQQDRKLDATRNSVGQGVKLLTSDQQKGVNQQGIRKDDKNKGPNSVEDKTKNSTEPATKEQHKGA
ncbi:hypothetical protein LWI29_014914 [Acer saccharum]|uniref:Uncharacterized protein n=1 Tax=Acer saccharum TaxID=4024 RepID=A0AA39W2H5_ACESA|nr:hypothetical protein LWI29_014914 [Acer saccharum]